MRVLLVADPPASRRWTERLEGMGADVLTQSAEEVHAVPKGTDFVVAMNLHRERERIVRSAASVGARVVNVPPSWAAAAGVMRPVLDRLSVEKLGKVVSQATGRPLTHRPFAGVIATPAEAVPPTPPPSLAREIGRAKMLRAGRERLEAAHAEAAKVVEAAVKASARVEPKPAPLEEPKAEVAETPTPPPDTRKRVVCETWLRADSRHAEMAMRDGFADYSAWCKVNGHTPLICQHFADLRHAARVERGLPNDRAWWAGKPRTTTFKDRTEAARLLLEADPDASAGAVIELVRSDRGLGIAPETVEKVRRAVKRKKEREAEERQTALIADLDAVLDANARIDRDEAKLTPPAQPAKEEPVAAPTPVAPQAADELAAAIQLLAGVMRERRVSTLRLTLDPSTGKVKAEWELVASGSVEV